MMDDDKIYEQIKEAAHKAELNDFPSMDKVWNRVSDKLDQQVLKTESSLWKKIAVAASVLLVVTLGLVLTNPAKQTTKVNDIVTMDSVRTATPTVELVENAVVVTEPLNPAIKEDADKILERHIGKPVAVPANDTMEKITVVSADPIVILSESSKTRKETDQSASNGVFLTTRKHEARSVQRPPNMIENSAPKKDVVQKPNPLLVVEGTVVPEGKKYDRTLKDALSQAENADEEIVVLKEPLYIINGIYYSEEDLFGEEPTSPYAPLNKQEIETVTILQGEKATAIYGAKGSKGVVIITTKNRKPADLIKGK